MLQGKASTNADRTASEEPLSSALILTPQNFWFDAESIPAIAPALADQAIYSVTSVNGVSQAILQYFASVSLQPVLGSANAFYSADLRDSIPYNQDPAGSYLYALKDHTGTTLAFGLNNWVVDNQAGVLTFYDGAPLGITAPLTISFYKYVGRKSFRGLIRSDGTVQMDNGYTPTLPQDVLTKGAFDAGVDLIDQVLDKLKPSAPANLSTRQLTISGIYSAFEASTGTVHADCINNVRPSITPSGPFADGDAGTLAAYLDSVSVGTRVLSIADDAGTYGSLVITSDVDPYAGVDGKKNFYKELYASIMPVSNLTIASHTARMTHSISGSTPVANFHVDDPQAPAVSNVALFPPVGVTRWISGVPSLAITDQVQATFDVTNAVRSHYGAIGAHLTSAYVQGATFPITTTPANGSTLSFSGNLQVLPNVYVENVGVSIVGLNSLQQIGPATDKTATIRIDTVSNEVRVNSGVGPAPLVFGSAFDSSRDVTNISASEELQLLNGHYQWPTGNYLNNRPIAGPVYTNVPIPANGYRWATFQPMLLTNANGFVLTILGAQGWLSSDNYTTENVRIFARVVQGGTPVTAWVDCNSPYPGVGIPGNVLLRQLDPAMVAGDINTSATSKRVTFGPTVRSGLLYIRIGLRSTDGKKFASISVQAN